MPDYAQCMTELNKIRTQKKTLQRKQQALYMVSMFIIACLHEVIANTAECL